MEVLRERGLLDSLPSADLSSSDEVPIASLCVKNRFLRLQPSPLSVKQVEQVLQLQRSLPAQPALSDRDLQDRVERQLARSLSARTLLQNK